MDLREVFEGLCDGSKQVDSTTITTFSMELDKLYDIQSKYQSIVDALNNSDCLLYNGEKIEGLYVFDKNILTTFSWLKNTYLPMQEELKRLRKMQSSFTQNVIEQGMGQRIVSLKEENEKLKNTIFTLENKLKRAEVSSNDKSSDDWGRDDSQEVSDLKLKVAELEAKLEEANNKAKSVASVKVARLPEKEPEVKHQDTVCKMEYEERINSLLHDLDVTNKKIEILKDNYSEDDIRSQYLALLEKSDKYSKKENREKALEIRQSRSLADRNELLVYVISTESYSYNADALEQALGKTINRRTFYRHTKVTTDNVKDFYSINGVSDEKVDLFIAKKLKLNKEQIVNMKVKLGLIDKPVETINAPSEESFIIKSVIQGMNEDRIRSSFLQLYNKNLTPAKYSKIVSMKSKYDVKKVLEVIADNSEYFNGVSDEQINAFITNNININDIELAELKQSVGLNA